MFSEAADVLVSSILAYNAEALAAGAYCLVCFGLGPKKSLTLGQGMFFLGAYYVFGCASTIIFFIIITQ